MIKLEALREAKQDTGEGERPGLDSRLRWHHRDARHQLDVAGGEVRALSPKRALPPLGTPVDGPHLGPVDRIQPMQHALRREASAVSGLISWRQTGIDGPMLHHITCLGNMAWERMPAKESCGVLTGCQVRPSPRQHDAPSSSVSKRHGCLSVDGRRELGERALSTCPAEVVSLQPSLDLAIYTDLRDTFVHSPRQPISTN